MGLSMRSTQPEVLDDEDIDLAVYERCVSELEVVNRLTLTHRLTLRWLARATKTLPVGAPFSVLDVACGHGDLLRAIARWADQRGLKAQLSGIDLTPRSAAVARNATPPEMNIDYRTGDVFSYIPAGRPDFIVSSQFTHHLTDAEVVEFLFWVEENSQRGWHIADLHRHALAYHGFPILTHLMRWHPIVRTDGMISIARSFRRKEWRAFIDKAALPAKISWQTPFRFCISRMKWPLPTE
jgi:2-polyprenyl-3-methyl-5-hydroxy-6-metoxy-1,4-benzoquinol methylase